MTQSIAKPLRQDYIESRKGDLKTPMTEYEPLTKQDFERFASNIATKEDLAKLGNEIRSEINTLRTETEHRDNLMSQGIKKLLDGGISLAVANTEILDDILARIDKFEQKTA